MGTVSWVFAMPQPPNVPARWELKPPPAAADKGPSQPPPAPSRSHPPRVRPTPRSPPRPAPRAAAELRRHFAAPLGRYLSIVAPVCRSEGPAARPSCFPSEIRSFVPAAGSASLRCRRRPGVVIHYCIGRGSVRTSEVPDEVPAGRRISASRKTHVADPTFHVLPAMAADGT